MTGNVHEDLSTFIMTVLVTIFTVGAVYSSQ